MSSVSTERTRQFYTRRSSVERYQALHGWLDKGEYAALSSVASEVRGLPLLDLGVGAGRTASLMRLLTDAYVGVDWSSEMVEVCRREHPGLDIRTGDARDLSAFASSTFKFVLFSFNGLDSIDQDGRQRVVSEAHRVLQPDGILGYSTLSLQGSFYGQRPWHQAPWRSSYDGRLDLGRALAHPQLLRVARFCFRLPSRLRKYPHLYANWWRNRALAEEHEDWAVAPVNGLDFNLAHFSTPKGERELLSEHGFFISDLFASTGVRVESDSAMPQCPWFFVVARKKPKTPES
jgi:SAM-dependent methyltransferase